METLTVTTPTHSTTPEIHTPNTPKHGFSDSWEPYSPRKSARLSQRINNNNNNNINNARTPSPRASTRQANLGSPRTRKNHLSTNTSTSLTPSTSPQKKRMPAMDSTRRASGNLTFEGTATAASVLGLGAKNSEPRTGRAAAVGLLPTPAKTPQKTPSPRTKANINAVRRNLFHQDEADVVPTPRRTRGRKHVLDSFAADDDDESFPIFTDTRERIPEVDPNEDNPFYGPTTATAPDAPRRRSKRQHVTVPGEGKITVEEAVKREDGMLIVLYVCLISCSVFTCSSPTNLSPSRGKRQFRKFADMDEVTASDALDEGDGGLDAAVESRLRRPMTRSSIKPRLLFPVPAPAPAAQRESTSIEDEEAETDIEEPIPTKDEMDIEEDEPQTPFDVVDETPGTPVAPKFAPAMQATPPTTQRTTRHGTKSAEETTPMKPMRGKKLSPFDGWRRIKNGSEGPSSKRSGESLASDAPKRTRA